MNEKEITRVSKFISLVLRHKPESIGLNLDEKGWAETSELLEKMNQSGTNISLDMLNRIVETNNKRRFSFNEDKTKIRANQGHSINVDLELKQKIPPQFLYHGTATKFLDSILKEGIKKKERQYVHLSIDIKTAITVGQRHGEPKILIIHSEQMHGEGFNFYLSENNIWLTEHVPVKYIRLMH